MPNPNCIRVGEHDEDPLLLADHQNKLARTLCNLDDPHTFKGLMYGLGLVALYKEYVSAAGDLFDSIVDDLPTIGEAPAPGVSGDLDLASEGALVAEFAKLISLMSGQAAESNLPEQYRQMPYDIWDYQRSHIDGPPLQLDLVIAFPQNLYLSISDAHIIFTAKEYDDESNAHLKHIGQLADYAMVLREHQPTRTFVPLLFLNGYYLELFVFTQKGYYKVSVGSVFFYVNRERDRQLNWIGKALRDLWFLLTLPANKFGFLFDSQTIPECLRFDMRTVPATMEEASSDADGMVIHMGKPIGRPARITGRCAYLFSAQQNDKPAILKLSWTRTDRLPEGAVYSVLEKHGVSNIPKIFASGILVKNIHGFRLEFLLMSHCGTPIVDHIRGMVNGFDGYTATDPQAALCVRQLAATLTDALAAGVLHRDISAENIVIRDGAAYIIDWGCARLVHPPTDAGFIANVSTHWNFDWDYVMEREKAKDSVTGTALYMSCRLLLGAKVRDIYDDLESLFYAMLDALSSRSRDAGEARQPIGFTYYDRSSTAAARLMCTQSSDLLLGLFGVSSRTRVAFKKSMDAMRRFLFLNDGIHIGTSVLEKNDFARTFDVVAASEFMGEETAHRLLGLLGEQVAQSPPDHLAPLAQLDARTADSDTGNSDTGNSDTTMHSADSDGVSGRPALSGSATLTAHSEAQSTSTSSSGSATTRSTRSALPALPATRIPRFKHASGATATVRPSPEPTNTNKAQVGPTRIAVVSTRMTRSRTNALKAAGSSSAKENAVVKNNIQAGRTRKARGVAV